MSLGPVSFLDKISCFHAAWGLLTMRWYIVNCRLHNPDQRATTAMPCSSVSRGEYILNLGQVQISSNLIEAALTAPQILATNPNPNNFNDMKHQSNPKRNAWYLVMALKCAPVSGFISSLLIYAVSRQHQFFIASGISRIYVRALGIVDYFCSYFSLPAGTCFDGGPYSAAGDAP